VRAGIPAFWGGTGPQAPRRRSGSISHSASGLSGVRPAGAPLRLVASALILLWRRRAIQVGWPPRTGTNSARSRTGLRRLRPSCSTRRHAVSIPDGNRRRETSISSSLTGHREPLEVTQHSHEPTRQSRARLEERGMGRSLDLERLWLVSTPEYQTDLRGNDQAYDFDRCVRELEPLLKLLEQQGIEQFDQTTLYADPRLRIFGDVMTELGVSRGTSRPLSEAGAPSDGATLILLPGGGRSFRARQCRRSRRARGTRPRQSGETRGARDSTATTPLRSDRPLSRKRVHGAALLQSPLTDSNRRPLLTMEVVAGCYVIAE
jgi:hypothetical protein